MRLAVGLKRFVYLIYLINSSTHYPLSKSVVYFCINIYTNSREYSVYLDLKK